jgi:type II secretory pathway pseudopilin PulG
MERTNAQRTNSESGFTLLDLLFVCALIVTLMTLAIPGLMRARGAAQQSSAIGTLRVISSAQLSYAITCGLGFYAPDFPALTTKPAGAVDAFLSKDLATGATFIRSGFNFSMAGTGLAGAPATCNGLAAGQASPGYAVVADPLDTSKPARYFGTNADGIIYEHTASFATIMPESGKPPSGAAIK